MRDGLAERITAILIPAVLPCLLSQRRALITGRVMRNSKFIVDHMTPLSKSQEPEVVNAGLVITEAILNEISGGSFR